MGRVVPAWSLVATTIRLRLQNGHQLSSANQLHLLYAQHLRKLNTVLPQTSAISSA